MEPGVAVPRHFHEYEEVILVEAGEVWVETGQGPARRLPPGQCVIIPAAHARMPGATAGPGTARVLFIWPVLEPFAPGKSTYLEGAPPAVTLKQGSELGARRLHRRLEGLHLVGDESGELGRRSWAW